MDEPVQGNQFEPGTLEFAIVESINMRLERSIGESMNDFGLNAGLVNIKVQYTCLFNVDDIIMLANYLRYNPEGKVMRIGDDYLLSLNILYGGHYLS